MSNYTAIFGQGNGRILTVHADDEESARIAIREQLDRPGRGAALYRWQQDGERLLRSANWTLWFDQDERTAFECGLWTVGLSALSELEQSVGDAPGALNAALRDTLGDAARELHTRDVLPAAQAVALKYKAWCDGNPGEETPAVISQVIDMAVKRLVGGAE
jgi:hypothetical protein